MTFEPQHTEGLKWELMFTDTIEAVFKSENEYFPIPTVVVPVTFNQPRIIVYPANILAPSHLWLAAKLTARVDIPSVDSAVRIYQENLRINNRNYLNIPITSSYQIHLEIPWRFTEMSFTIWQFDPT